MTLVVADNPCGLLGTVVIGVHVREVVEIHFFKSVADGRALLFASFVQRIVRSVLVAGAGGVAENEGYLFSGADAAEYVVDRRELVGGRAESPAFGAEGLNAILTIFAIFSVLAIFTVFAVLEFANLFGAAVDFVSVNLVVLYDRARGSILTVVAVFTVGSVLTIGAILAVGAVLELADLLVAAVNVETVVFGVFNSIARGAVLTVVTILTIVAVFTIGAILTVGTVFTVSAVFAVFAVTERADLFFATVDVVSALRSKRSRPYRRYHLYH